ncbi:MAG: cyanophycinase [Caldilineaceae bacterium]
MMAKQTTIGPARGSLVIVGGGAQALPEILRRFIALAGGFSAPIVIIPTAAEEEYPGPHAPHVADFMAAGALNLQVLHTRDPEVANTDAFLAPLQQAQGIWFGGGRHWRLADAYLHTRAEAAFHALLQRGGVIGGTSAGATIQGSFMVRGDTAGNQIMVGDHTTGFGFLRNVTIDQHHLKRNRHFDLVDVIAVRPELLGIGIDEDTAIVVTGDEFEVIGQSYVAIYDHGRMVSTRGHFYFLAPGDRFDLQTRSVIPPPPKRGLAFDTVTQQRWQS